MARYAGACRWLWNHMLAMQKAQYEADGTFVFNYDMQKMLPGLKKQVSWLSEAPSGALKRVCRHLDRALRDCFKNGKGFPQFKKRGVSREGFYVLNDKMRIEPN